MKTREDFNFEAKEFVLNHIATGEWNELAIKSLTKTLGRAFQEYYHEGLDEIDTTRG